MTSERVEVRPATPNDAEAIARVHVRTWQSAYAGILPERALEALAVADRFRLWQRLLDDPDASVCAHVARVRGKVVGFCSVGPPREPRDRDPDTSELVTIYVDPQFQARGIGTRLLAEAEHTMREWGALQGVLWVLTDNEPAKVFYSRHGWTADGTVKDDTILGMEIQEVRFRKILVEWSA